MAMTATRNTIQEMGAAIMASPTNLQLETAVKQVLEHMVEMVGMDTVSHATRMWEFRITKESN